MNIHELQRSWEKLGKTAPLKSMLPWHLKGKIESINELFASGCQEIDEIMTYVTSLNVSLANRKALDFGCGIGRLTQALTRHFDEVHGVDIASSIIALADEYNHQPHRCKYYINTTDNLNLFPNNQFDFIYASNTLHNINPRYYKKYIEEFIRILTPSGLIIFQLSSEPKTTWKGLVFHVTPTSLLNMYRREKYGFELYSMKREKVCRLLEQSGATIVDIQEEQSPAGKEWVGFRYCIMKRAA